MLTGGGGRIDGALHLLAEGRARRLLISGVNPSVDLKALAGTVDKDLRGGARLLRRSRPRRPRHHRQCGRDARLGQGEGLSPR